MAFAWSRILLSPSSSHSVFSDLTLPRSSHTPCSTSSSLLHRSYISVEPPFSVTCKLFTPILQLRCSVKSTGEDQLTSPENDFSFSSQTRHHDTNELHTSPATSSSADYFPLGIREPVYEVSFFNLFISPTILGISFISVELPFKDLACWFILKILFGLFLGKMRLNGTCQDYILRTKCL